MNTVALPASASTSALAAESDLARQAAKGSSEAFEELFRRHSQPAWRLAQAMAADRESAIDAVREGFTRALRGPRTIRRDEAGAWTFRPQLLAAVYRSTIDSGRESSSDAAAWRSRSKSAEAALAEAAFRSLPERWRAAVWLDQVESMDTGGVASVLAVSIPVATQLISKGQRALAGRFAQAHEPVPDHLGPVLRGVARAVPANLAEVVGARWAAAGTARPSLFAPVGAWFEDRAARPMAATIGAIFGLGIIGLGILPSGAPLHGAAGANAPSTSTGAIPVSTCFGVACAHAPRAASLGGLGQSSLLGLLTSTGGSGSAGSAAATTAALSGNPVTSGSAPSTSSSAPGGGSATSGGGTTGGTGNGTTGGTGTGTGTGGTGTGGTGGTPVVNLAPVATVTTSGSTTQVNLLPTGSGSVASISITTPTTTPAPTPPPTTLPSLSSTVTGVVSGTTQTVTTLLGGTTLPTLPGGL